MAFRYHINPNTGNPGICRSNPNNPRSKGCPFTDEEGNPPEHYSSRKEARAAYEIQQEEREIQKAEQRRAEWLAQHEIELEKAWPSPSPEQVKKYEDMGYEVDREYKNLTLKGVNKYGFQETMTYGGGYFKASITLPGEDNKIFEVYRTVMTEVEGQNRKPSRMFELLKDDQGPYKSREDHLDKLNKLNYSIGSLQKRMNKMIADSKELFGEPNEDSEVYPKIVDRYPKIDFKGYDPSPVTIDDDFDTGNKVIVKSDDEKEKVVSIVDSEGKLPETDENFFITGTKRKNSDGTEDIDIDVRSYSNESPYPNKYARMSSCEWLNYRRRQVRNAIIDSKKVEEELSKN